MNRPVLLALSLVALAVGPVLGGAADALRLRVSQGILVLLVFLVVVQVLPEAWEALGPGALFLLIAGWALPTLAERVRHSEQVHALPRGLVALGLAGHALLDGAAIGAPTDTALGLAVLLHRVPAAAAAWMVLAPSWGKPATVGVLVLTGAVTIAGWWAAGEVLHLHDAGPVAALSAFVAGSLLHLATHRLPHGHDHVEDHVEDHEHDGHAHHDH